MYCVVQLTNCGTKIILKHKWCEYYYKLTANIANAGALSKKTTTKIFFSKNKNEKADFNLRVSLNEFEPWNRGIYKVTLLDIFCE